MMCVYCKGDDAERALCPSCRARFSERGRLIAKAIVACGQTRHAPPRAIRPQSLAREGYERAWHAKRNV